MFRTVRYKSRTKLRGNSSGNCLKRRASKQDQEGNKFGAICAQIYWRCSSQIPQKAADETRQAPSTLRASTSRVEQVCSLPAPSADPDQFKCQLKYLLIGFCFIQGDNISAVQLFLQPFLKIQHDTRSGTSQFFSTLQRRQISTFCRC